jgi:hypothetical protein
MIRFHAQAQAGLICHRQQLKMADNSPRGIRLMQAAHTWALARLTLDREFESTPLRHTVCFAENLAFSTTEI